MLRMLTPSSQRFLVLKTRNRHVLPIASHVTLDTQKTRHPLRKLPHPSRQSRVLLSHSRPRLHPIPKNHNNHRSNLTQIQNKNSPNQDPAVTKPKAKAKAKAKATAASTGPAPQETARLIYPTAPSGNPKPGGEENPAEQRPRKGWLLGRRGSQLNKLATRAKPAKVAKTQ